MIFLLLWAGSLNAAWLLKRSVAGPDARAICRLETDTGTLPDGYDETRARLVVTSATVQVVSEAPLDAAFADLGLQIDRHALVNMDALTGRKQAQFKTPYPALVNAFKKGRQVRAQLRFWPTWPATGTHSVVFSLHGFSKAYALMQRCEP